MDAPHRKLTRYGDPWVAIVTGVEGCFMAGADLKDYIPRRILLRHDGSVNTALEAG